MTTDMHKAPSVARKALNSPGSATPVACYDLSTSEDGRRYIAEFFATELRRHDFTDYISTRLAADFACALAQHLAARQPGAQVPRAWLIHWSHIPLESTEVTTSASRVDAVNALTDPPRIEPLYAAPPAQGIDLGQLWEQAYAAMLDQRKRNKHDCFVLCCLKDDVQKLIDDQRDAAPGVGNG